MKRFLAYISTLIITLAFGVAASFGQSAAPGMCYATTGGGTGNLYTINLATGAGSLEASTGTGGLPGLAVNPAGNLFATTRFTDTPLGSLLYKVNATTGATTLIGDTGILADAIAFDSVGVLYAANDEPSLYKIDTSDASVTFVAGLSRVFAGFAFDPTDGTLYASTGGAFGEADQIWSIDASTGVETYVGVTGLSGATPDIAFDVFGNLYGFKGGGQSTNNLISINKTTAAGSVLGSVGFTHMSGFTCYNPTDDGGGGGSDPVAIYIDIKPGACPNQLNTKAKSVVKVAILGTPDLDVNDIDVTSLTFEGLVPTSWEYVDVSQPPLDEGPCACTIDGADGYVDLQLRFENETILAALGDVEDGDEFTLTMEGALNDSTEIAGEDCVVIKVPGEKSSKGSELEPLPTAFALEQNYPNPFNPTTSIEFALPLETHVELTVFNAMGQQVASLVSSTLAAGRHSVQWNATDDAGRMLASGLYIYRIAAGEFIQTQKMLLLE